VQVASATAVERLRLNSFGHAYIGAGAVLIAVLFYLGLAAQITQASYDITRLQDQQRQLIAEQEAAGRDIDLLALSRGGADAGIEGG